MAEQSWGHDWTAGLRLWTQRNGQPLLGPGRVELLENIDRWHSISEAARRMHMSYRRAWLLVQSVNESAGEPLVAAAVGGTHGGGACLTERGRWAVTVYRDLQARLQQTADRLQLQRLPNEDAYPEFLTAPFPGCREGGQEAVAVVPSPATRARRQRGGRRHAPPAGVAVVPSPATRPRRPSRATSAVPSSASPPP